MTSLIRNDDDIPVVPEPVIEEAPVEPPAVEEVPFESLPQFWQEEITRKREAEANYRTRAKRYDEAFEGYDDETKEAFLEYARLSYAAQNGDEAAAAELQAFMGEEPEPEAEPEPYVDPIEAARAAAREETERVFLEREQKAAQAEAVSNVQNAAQEMGYELKSADYVLLMKFANEPEILALDNPMEEADKLVKAYHQAIIEQHLAAKSAQTDGTTHVASIGSPPGAPDPNAYIKDPTLSEAEKFAIARERAADRFRSGR
jgi:hypothetical protein